MFSSKPPIVTRQLRSIFKLPNTAAKSRVRGLSNFNSSTTTTLLLKSLAKIAELVASFLCFFGICLPKSLATLAKVTPPPTRLPVLTFPTVGPTKIWPLVQSQIDHWRELYPTIDVLGECRKALAWVEAHPDRRKTHRGMPKFLTGWLGRSTDRGGRASSEPVVDPILAKRAADLRRIYG